VEDAAVFDGRATEAFVKCGAERSQALVATFKAYFGDGERASTQKALRLFHALSREELVRRLSKSFLKEADVMEWREASYLCCIG
jgi:hypothetical protein